MEITGLLSALRPLAAIESFEEHVKLCAGVARGSNSPGDVERAGAAIGLPLSVQEALVSIFVEATRTGVTSDDLIAPLSSVLPPDRARIIASAAADGQRSMRAAMDSLSLRPDEVINVTWERATVAAAAREQPLPGGTPAYTICLTLRAPDGNTRPVTFSASVEELTDLVASLKGAVRQVERELGG